MMIDNEHRLEQLVNYILNCMEIHRLCIFGSASCDISTNYLYKNIEILYNGEIDKNQKEEIVLFMVESAEELCEFKNLILDIKKHTNLILYIRDWCGYDYDGGCRIRALYPDIENCNKAVALLGDVFEASDGEYIVPYDFKVLAIIHCYNENDIIENTIEYLLEQDVDVYILDNWSNDGTYESAFEMKTRYPDRIYLKRFPESGKSEYYEWYNQLAETERISKELNYNWYIHYDADEMRIGPWSELNLRQTIYKIDSCGYNEVENTVIDFKLTGEENDIFMKDTYFDFGHRVAHFEQAKSWKKCEDLDLKSSGGHEARIENPKVFPLKILNRHYPMRSVEQAKRKINIDRLPRFEKERRIRGWHGHYSKIQDDKDILHNSAELIKWDCNTFNQYYVQLFLGIGIEVDYVAPPLRLCDDFVRKKVVIYGAGKLGIRFFDALSQNNIIVKWVDLDYKRKRYMRCCNVESPFSIFTQTYDCIVVAIDNKNIFNEVTQYLCSLGVDKEIILWGNTLLY